MFRYSPLDEALDALLSRARPTEVEEVPLPEAVGRVSAEDLRAPWDIPRRPTSLFDGYAVSSADTS
ncbi:MAG TPA: molybdopterin molybdenumtransferase MoeA, partial [Candidatus Korarchaeota archaeon]|nr:molybdopterin molybdenumtransferase MoeA [Candidatus Korarchaeota archaeon]